MKKKTNLPVTFIWCAVGIFAGRSLYTVWNYKTNPLMYEYSSFPWYTEIIVSGLVAAAITVLMLIILLVKHAIEKRKQSNAD